MWLKIALVGAAALAGIGSVVVLKMKHDNAIEETCEKIIKVETGKDIDLTPSSPEVSENKDTKIEASENKESLVNKDEAEDEEYEE